MKTIKICLLLTFLFCSGNHLVGQPGESEEKYNIHEIKLHQREDGSKVGAIAWSTAPSDSIQKFVVRNLSIMEPVQILLQALSPNDEVTLQFVKEKWDQTESSISAKGKEIGKKIFRTYKTAAMKISAPKTGIPYIIFVQVGKKLPANKAPLFRITNDKEEYENLLKTKGKTSKNKPDDDITGIPLTNNESGGGNTTNNSSLLYIIIGLLALIVAFLGYYVFFRKGSKKMLFLILLLNLGLNISWGQAGSPTPLSTNEINNLLGYNDNLTEPTEPGSVPVIEYGSPEWYEQLSQDAGIPIEQGPEPMTEDEFKEMVLHMREEFTKFKEDFVDNMPGEDTEGGNRALPPGTNEAELNRLRNRIRRLETQVEYLSARDRQYAPDEGNDEQIPVYCENIEECLECIMKREEEIGDLRNKFRDLNNILIHNDWEMETGIETGNNLANMAPGMALGWQQQLINIQKARKDLWIKYHNKYGELLERLDNVEKDREICNEMSNADEFAFDWRANVKDEIRMGTPELVTPIF